MRAKKSITVQLLIFFMIIWGVISILLMSVLYWTQHLMTETILEGQKERVSYYTAIVNADLSRITNLLRQMCVDNEVAAFLNEREQEEFDYQDYIAFQSSYEKLKNYRAFSMYIDDVFLVIPQTNELLRASEALTEIPNVYKENIEKCLKEIDNVFFSTNGCMVYLSRGASGTVVGVEVSVRHIRTMLNALNPGYFDCFLVDGNTGNLLGNSQRGENVSAFYDAILKKEVEQTNGVSQITSADKTVWLYDCVDTPGNYFRVYLFAKEKQIFAGIHRIRQVWMLISMIILAIPFGVGGVFHHMLARPMKKLVTAMQAIEHQEWSYRLSEEEPAEFQYVFRQYNQMVNQIEILIRQVYEKQVQTEQARRKQLQAQINPHFLYNTLNAITWQAADKGEEEISILSSSLGRFFRISLSKGEEVISLREEIEHVTSYLEIQSIRYGEKLNYDIEVDSSLMEYKVLKLILQPLAENSIYHGIKEKAQAGWIHIRAQLIHIDEGNDRLQISVWDNGLGIACDMLKKINYSLANGETNSADGYGIFNVNERIRLYYGEQYGLLYESEEGEWTKAILTLPVVKAGNEICIRF